MRTVGVKILKNKLSEYIRLVAAGETVLVTDGDMVVAELRPPVGHGPSVAARTLLHRLALLELAPPVLARALEPFPMPVRTLDALHLASLEFLRVSELRFRLPVTMSACWMQRR